jgi:hypothetical protein
MIPAQTLGVVSGVFTGLVYAAAVLGTGALALRAALGPNRVRDWTRRDGPITVAVLAFVTGQGLSGFLWLTVALVGALDPHAVRLFALGGCLGLCLSWRTVLASGHEEQASDNGPGFYGWMRRGIAALLALHGLAALLPTRNDDALMMYLVTPLMVAFTHGLDFQPYVLGHGLMPLQVEMHWAALFSVSNETAVTFWDYLCSLGTLGALAAVGMRFSRDSRTVTVLLLMMLTTPGFTLLMGVGKPDNAAAQFGLAALAWLMVGPLPARRAILLSGLCLGWALGSRYTAFVLIPAWLVLLFRLVSPRLALLGPAAMGVALAWIPMLFKNWLLVGYPLAPLFGNPDSLWLWRMSDAAWNLSWVDVLFHPFVWTFAHRPHMLGNISPLFLGLLFPWLLCRDALDVRRSRAALALGALTVMTWIAIEARALHTRYLFVGLALAAIGLAPAFVAIDEALGRRRRLQITGRTGLVFLLGFWLAVSGWGAWEAVRYTAGRDRRADRYRRKEGYDAAEWLNANVTASARVSLLGFKSYRYLLRPDILQGSESTAELERTWHAARMAPSPAVLTQLATSGGFSYVVAKRGVIALLVEALPPHRGGPGGRVAFMGDQYAVLALAR